MAIIPWKKIGDPEILAEGYGKQFIKQKFKDHNNKETDFYFQNQPAWSVVLPITEEGNVLLIKQYKQGADIIIEELPGGTADFKDEPPEEIMKRELREETGYEPGKVIALGSGWVNSRNSTTPFYCFLATGCRKVGPARLDQSEQEELIQMPIKDWIQEMLNGEWVQWDAYMVLLRALPHLELSITLNK